MAFKKGQSGNPAGKPKGARNKVSRDIAAYARSFLESDEYRASANRRMLTGKAPHLETMLHQYAYGKPPDKIEVTGADGGPVEFIVARESIARKLARLESRDVAGLPTDPDRPGSGSPGLPVAVLGAAEATDPGGPVAHLANPERAGMGQDEDGR